MRTTAVPFDAVVIGASAGAIEALSRILPNIPADYPAAIMVVVHVPPDSNSMLVELFQRKSEVRVKEAEDKETIEVGTVYFAPPDYHVLVEPNRRLSLSGEEPINYSRPSIDVLFESAAECYRERLLGIVLTGANSDGARGLRAIVDAGGAAVVQDPDSALVSAMPLAALQACPTARTLDLEEISDHLRRIALGTVT